MKRLYDPKQTPWYWRPVDRLGWRICSFVESLFRRDINSIWWRARLVKNGVLAISAGAVVYFGDYLQWKTNESKFFFLPVIILFFLQCTNHAERLIEHYKKEDAENYAKEMREEK